MDPKDRMSLDVSSGLIPKAFPVARYAVGQCVFRISFLLLDELPFGAEEPHLPVVWMHMPILTKSTTL